MAYQICFKTLVTQTSF